MRVSDQSSMYPVVRRASNNFSLTAVKNSSDQNYSVSINKIYDDLIEQKNKSIAKPGKGFYIVISNPNSNSYAQKLKSNLTPLKEKINNAYHPELRKELGLLVDMIV